MRKKINSKNVHKDLMPSSYNKSIRRIVGLKDSVKYEIPAHILEHRRHFWDMFYDKYSKKISDDKTVDILTLKVCDSKSKHKSLSYIQNWVNTGYLTYKADESSVDEGEMSESSIPSKSKECSHLLHHDVDKETLNVQYMKPNYGNSSSSSSVDTAKYILANMNATNKAETMAIVEGANTSISSQDTQNIITTKFITDEIDAKKRKDTALDNKHPNYQQYNSTDENKNTTKMQKNLVTNVKTLSEVLNVNNKLEQNNKFCHNRSLDETLVHVNDNDETRNSYKNDSLNAELSQISENNITRENSRDSTTKIGHRKKLYTISDSPTDLIKMQYSNKNIAFESQSNLHPALDFKHNKLKKHKIFKMRKKNVFRLSNRSLINNSLLSKKRSRKHLQKTTNQIFDKTSTPMNNSKLLNDTYSINLNKSQNLIECKNKKSLNMFPSTNESANAQQKLSKAAIHLKKRKRSAKENKKSNTVTQDFIRLNPQVCLTRISEVDIQKYKNLNNVIKKSYSSNGNRKRRSQRNIVSKLKGLNLKVPPINLPRLNIQKLGKQNKMKISNNLNPTVRLKRISEFEIQKYTKSRTVIVNLGNLNPKVRLEKLTDFDIQKYRNSNNKQMLYSNDSFYKTGKNNNVNILQNSNFLPDIINISDKDSSDESTLIILKCENSIDSNNFSLSEMCKSVKSNDRFSEIKESLNTNICDSTENKEKDTVCENITRSASSNIFQNVEKSRKVTTRSHLKFNTGKRNSMYKKICERRKEELKRKRNFNNISLSNVKNANLKKNLHLKENVHVYINDTASSSILETISKSSCSSNAHINNNKKLNMLLLSEDEDDEFVKLIYCPEDSRLKKDFIEKTDSDLCNARNDIMISVSSQEFPNKQKDKFDSIKNNDFKELKYNNSGGNLSYFNGENLNYKNLVIQQNSNSSVRKDYRSQLTDKQVMLKNRKKLLPKVNISRKNKSSVSNLHFETRILDSDSLTISSASSNISFNE